MNIIFEMNDSTAHRNDERGNVLFLILIAAALFAALSYVVVQSSRSGGGDAAREKYALDASEIQGYVTALQTAVGRLLINGCNLDNLNFDNEADGGLHTNPNAPTNNSCDVFHPAGGGVPLKTPMGKWASDPVFYYSGSSAVTGIGTTCATPECSDLVLVMRGVHQGLCLALNKGTGFNVFADLPIDTQQACPYVGTMDCAGNDAAEIIFTAPDLNGRNSVCYNDSVHGLTFMHVLLER